MIRQVQGKPVRVLVDAVSARHGGALSRLRALLPELDRREGLTLTIVATSPLSDELARLCPGSTVVAEPRRPLAVRIAWEQIILRRRAKAFDVLYMPGNFGMAFPPIPIVVGVQSLWHWGRAGRRERARCRLRLRLRLTVESALARFTIKRAAAIACVSQTICTAVTEDLGATVPRVVTPGAPPDLPGTDRIDHGGAIAIGTDLPHKDWDGLVAAFAADDSLPSLLLVGPVTDERRMALERAGRGRVQLVGLVTDRSRLAALIRGSICVVAHSRLESFGFVPLEGVVSKVPVAMSDIPAHREVCGKAGHVYPIDSPHELSRAVSAAVAAGPPTERPPALQGSWAQTAGRLRDLFCDVAASQAPVAPAWDDLAQEDPLWAVLSHPGRRYEGWSSDEFFAEGVVEIRRLVSAFREEGLPEHFSRALDFGCGPGRLSRALAEAADQVVGIDASPHMVDLARRLNGDMLNCNFEIVAGERATDWTFGRFDLVVSHIVLQHVPKMARRIELLRRLAASTAPGGVLAVQVTTQIPPIHRLQLRPRTYEALRRLGASAAALYRELGLHPIRMFATPRPAVEHVLEHSGMSIVRATTSVSPKGVESVHFIAWRSDLDPRQKIAAFTTNTAE